MIYYVVLSYHVLYKTGNLVVVVVVSSSTSTSVAVVV